MPTGNEVAVVGDVREERWALNVPVTQTHDRDLAYAPPHGVSGGRVLVTGAAGFIGARVSELLLAAGRRVVGVDNFDDAYDRRLQMWRLARLRSHPRFVFRRCDVTDRAATDEVVGEAGTFDAVVHMAAKTGVRHSTDDPWVYLETNATGTLNVLEACRRSGVAKLVLSSTSSVYGTRNAVPFREDTDTDGPLSPYAASKKAAEVLTRTYHNLYGLDVTVLRYFSVYGPAGRPDMSVFRFVRWLDRGEPVVIFGDGRQSRDLTYVDDIARGTVAALRPVGFEVVNLGSDRPVVLLDLLHHIEQLMGRRAVIERREPHPADSRETWADIERARMLLDWKPTTDWRDGVAQFLAWYGAERRWAGTIRTAR